MKNESTHLRMTKEIRDDLKRLAMLNDKTMQAMMRELIKFYIKGNK